MLTIGTAGHIDHGKSAVVKRMTGTDPDRLPEEKSRGMTIDLGFAFMSSSSGEEIGFVDVPGHERFVRNMIAGVGGIDVVMLVVAADDGWMPQSEEHFQIIRLLGITRGLIVINKIDLVDDDWLQLLTEDVKERVKGSFLAEAPIFAVSAATGAGFEPLIAYLKDLPAQIASSRDIDQARLYIDRSFIRPGIGKVVAGTLRGGSLSVGQAISVWPGNHRGKVRSLQLNSREVERATPGQRTALSVTGVDKEYLLRGGCISDRTDLSFFRDHPVLAMSVELLANSPVTLADRRRVLLITGTTEVEGEIRVFQQKTIAPSTKGVVFFKPDEPPFTLIGDHYIMRLPTPMVTLGGGRVLDHLDRFPRRKTYAAMEYLNERMSGTLEDLIVSELKKRVIAPVDDFLKDADHSRNDILKIIERLTKEKTAGRHDKYVFLNEELEQAKEQFHASILRFLEDKPHLKGLSADELARASKLNKGLTAALVSYMVSTGEMVRMADRYNLVGRGMSLKGELKKAHDQIMAALKSEPYTPPRLTDLAKGGKNFREAIKYVLEAGEGYKCGSEFVFLPEVWDEILVFIKNHLAEKDFLNVADLKNRFGFTRKFAIPILEETDRTGLTQRQGDIRVKGNRFEK
jgi:selenocysteine-specific elongation factor